MKVSKLLMLIKQESCISQKLVCHDLWYKAAIPGLFNDTEVMSSVPDKENCSLKTFSKNTKLNDSGISLPAFPSRSNLKLHNVLVTPELSYMLAEIFNTFERILFSRLFDVRF